MGFVVNENLFKHPSETKSRSHLSPRQLGFLTTRFVAHAPERPVVYGPYFAMGSVFFGILIVDQTIKLLQWVWDIVNYFNKGLLFLKFWK